MAGGRGARAYQFSTADGVPTPSTLNGASYRLGNVKETIKVKDLLIILNTCVRTVAAPGKSAPRYPAQ